MMGMKSSRKHSPVPLLGKLWVVLVGRVLLLQNKVRLVKAEGPVACTQDTTDDICTTLQGQGSICGDDGFCTNAFAQGCLYERLEGWNKKRVCNSDDSAEEWGKICQPPQFDSYMEVRITSGNWESSYFNAWLFQIVLSEMLGVPTTLEPADANTRISFFDKTGSVEYGKVRNVEAFDTSDRLTDCRLANRFTTNHSEYEPCSNLIPEYWSAAGPWTTASIENGSMEPPEASGVLALEGLFIPKFTAERDPSLLSYIGLQGEKNRQKLVDTFLRPTTWNDYCKEVAGDNCTTPNNVTMRAPIDEDEGNVYFAQDLYTGYFRKTNESFGNETHSGTGHFIDYPCGWNSFAEQQLYHLDIPLSGDKRGQGRRGYKGPHMFQILKAANATRSNIMIMWAKPDPIYQELIGTDMELHPVLLPPVTQECLANKRRWDDVCAEDWTDRVGDPKGACEEPPVALHVAMSTSLTRVTNDQSVSPAERSPAVDAIQLYSTTAAVYGSWFDYAIERDALSDGRRTLLRDATCQWVIDNFDSVQNFVPFSYPRVIENGQQNSALVTASIVLGALAVILVLVASTLVYLNQHRQVMIFAQIEFLWLLLAGLLIMSVGALISAIPSTNGTCIGAVWFINVGYTLELAPLLVKVSAINKLLTASSRMQKVEIKRSRLFGSVLAISSLIVIFTLVWTVMDPPGKEGELTLTETLTARNETIVYRNYYCSSESNVWQIIAFGWTGMLLFSATVLAVEMRNVRQDFNESQTLGMMTYSHFVFVTLRVVTSSLSETLGEADSARYRSILLSVDAMATLGIYFLPKFVVLRKPDSDPNSSSSRGSSSWASPSTRKIIRDGSKAMVKGPEVPSSPEVPVFQSAQYAIDENKPSEQPGKMRELSSSGASGNRESSVVSSDVVEE